MCLNPLPPSRVLTPPPPPAESCLAVLPSLPSPLQHLPDNLSSGTVLTVGQFVRQSVLLSDSFWQFSDSYVRLQVSSVLLSDKLSDGYHLFTPFGGQKTRQFEASVRPNLDDTSLRSYCRNLWNNLIFGIFASRRWTSLADKYTRRLDFITTFLYGAFGKLFG